MKPAPAASDGLRDAVNALLHQIEIGDFVDSNGHSAKMLKPVHDLMRLLSEPATDNASLRADNVRLQNEVVGPLRERVKEAEAESLAFVYERNAAQERVHALAGRVKVLEDALGGLLFAEQDECTLENYAAASEAARAALGDTP